MRSQFELVPPDKITEEDYEYFQYIEKEKQERERRARELEKEKIEKFKESRRELVWTNVNPELLMDSNASQNMKEEIPEVKSELKLDKRGPKLESAKKEAAVLVKPVKRTIAETKKEVEGEPSHKKLATNPTSVIEKICNYESSDDD